MIRVNQLKLPIEHSEEMLRRQIIKTLRLKNEKDLIHYQIRKQSIDARKKNELSFVYTVDVEVKQGDTILHKNKNANIIKAKDIHYHFPAAGEKQLSHRPVIVGSGPAGMFCAYELAKHGYCPIILERGSSVEERTAEVERFWKDGILNPKTNVQFGEGGAGTFSDGKLNTLVKDVAGRNREVLEIFVKMGAPEEILYINKPHIGTDILKTVVKNIRLEIERMGGTYCFFSQLTDITLNGKKDKVEAIRINSEKETATDVLVLAIGHSARDTFPMLQEAGLKMEAKAFAVGFRVEHPQTMIDACQYNGHKNALLPAASYKLTANLENHRGVYSFCMCPGGYVVNASSEEGMLAVNGMSYHARAGQNANSAIIVSVRPDDFEGDGPLAGIAFQRKLEKNAYRIGNGAIPQQLYGDFKENRISTGYGDFESTTKGAHIFANLREIFPKELATSFQAGMEFFPKYIPDYNREDAILSGVESRTSSPVRITRNESFESNIAGIYPCGEGAGYAGGIMSAAMDGLKVAEAIAGKYARLKID